MNRLEKKGLPDIQKRGVIAQNKKLNEHVLMHPRYPPRNPMPPWKELNENIQHECPIFRSFLSDRQNETNNRRFEFFLMDGLDWCHVFAFTPEKELVLVRQYRHGIDAYTIELPGGCVEQGEDPALSVLRELGEETGYTADHIEHLGTFFPNPAMQSMQCFSYIAHNCKPSGLQALDPGESIEVFTVPFKKAQDMVRSGEINHSIMIAGFGLFGLKKGEF